MSGLSLAPRIGRGIVRWSILAASALVIFGAFVLAKGVDPVQMYADVWASTFGDSAQLQTVLVRFAVLLLAGLAVAVPARAGLLNVGGEGQIVVGAVAAAGVALATDQRMSGGVVLLLMVLAAAAAGAAWAAIAGVLRLTVHVNEAITTLLLNYIAIDLLLFLIYEPWKDASGFGQPSSRPLAEGARLPLLSGTTVNFGLFLALAALAAVWWVLRYTSWGFQLRVVGGNPEAARRGGLKVGLLLLSAMLVGGALAGMAGMVHFAGTELKLRAGMTVTFGYVAFLASWLAGHNPLRVAGAALLLAGIAMAGDSLQIDSGLPAAAVNILMAVVLIVVLGRPALTKLRRSAA
jgi:ABC-type uncharacterized transport system permease subunit